MRPRPRAFTAWDGVLAAALVGGFLFLLLRPAPHALTAEVTSAAGARTLALEPPRRFEVPGPLGVTVVEVGPEGARIVSSPCPNQLCVKAGRVRRPGQPLACVPNRVSVRLLPRGEGPEKDAADGGVDAVAR